MQQKIETTLAKLVSFPSIPTDSTACHAVIDFVRGELEPLGLYVTSATDQPNPWFIATTQDTKTPDVLLTAHLDVVPAALDMFSLRSSEGKLYGRGTYDMKFAAACYIEFAKAHADILHTLNIGFFFTTDEEIGGGTSVPPLLDMGWRPQQVFLPDGGEPWHIEARAKGFYGVTLTATGKTAHGSRPWEGFNAIHTLMDIAQELRDEYPTKDKTDATLQFTTLEAGLAVNQIADSATAMFDFRTFDPQQLTALKNKLEHTAATKDVTFDITQQGSPVLFDKHAPIVQDFLALLQETTGQLPRYSDSFGGSDARYFASYNIPTIIIEPNGGGRHTADEWILAQDIEKYYRLMERWLISVKN